MNIKIEKNNKMALRRVLFRSGAGIKEMCRLWLERDCQESPEDMAKLLLDEYKNRDC